MAGTELRGMTAVITGGSGSLGAGCALRFLQDGAALLLMGRGKDALEATKTSLLRKVGSGRVEVFVGDAGKPDHIQEALQQAYDMQQRLDILVPTVGGGGVRPLLLHDAETFQYEINLNIMTAFLAIRYGAPLMKRGGSIVCISSTAAVTPAPWYSAYMAGKAGMEGLVKVAAEELGGVGIRVNAVRPGPTASDNMSASLSDDRYSAPMLAELPLGRSGVPADVAGAVRYFAGPESSWVTGQCLNVDGGLQLRKIPNFSFVVADLFGQDALDAVQQGKVPKDIRSAPLPMSKFVSVRS